MHRRDDIEIARQQGGEGRSAVESAAAMQEHQRWPLATAIHFEIDIADLRPAHCDGR